MDPAKEPSQAKPLLGPPLKAALKSAVAGVTEATTSVTSAGTSHSSYWTWLSQWKKPSPPVGWCHTTDGWGLREILKSESIAPQPCSVFNEPLNYFFYGRPAYRLRDQECLAAQVRAPVIFLFTHELLAQGKRVFPFDSGAFSNKRYKKWFHENSTLKDFEIPAGSSAPELQISVFFENLEKYFNCEGRTPPLEINGNFEAEAVMNMLTDIGAQEADDRRVAVELQSGTPISLYDARLVAIILPKELLKAEYVQAFLLKHKNPPQALTYQFQKLKRVCEYQTELERIAREFYCGVQ